MDNRGTNPIKDIWLWMRFLCLLWQEKPDVFLGYTIKPNIYGSLAARCLGIAVINNISGLGATFIHDSLTTRIVKILYRFALRGSAKVFFQNDDDRQLFISQGLAPVGVSDLLPGSGVNLQYFSVTPLPNSRTPFRFLLIGRMLRDKGVQEFVEAAKLVKQQYPDAEFGLLGFVGVPNPNAISLEQIQAWTKEAGIHYLGESQDVREYINRVHCVVLPSYREGTPRSLLEGAAMGRPLIATDVPGCREVVEHGVNGWLCQARDAADLARYMIKMMNTNDATLQMMATASRSKAERQFDEAIVVGRYLKAINALSG
jgi:glycosyltransferase involved in cell wall biosynthesis